VLIFTDNGRIAHKDGLMPIQIVILSVHSLFTEGVASRLRQYPERVDVRFVDPQQPDYIEKIAGIQPSAVIMDAAETETTCCCILCDLLSTLENVTIVRLDVQQKDIQLITSIQQRFNEVRDIVDIIEQSPQMLGL
jgi:DNA-binding NarL/FixJ family response regulator